ncbi:MAG TPA: 2-amino-4-hydroxy-6-hydroxymethyldihydropteridine diphosphokinase [Clostridia bacterium]|jgi:2-amino-4-hydroxy-6-hydroxymethyldihydropteridine diphosphokinase|nr:2-amino-4-hydroxy-6-hydroxymethyldihydropteridine diphosphokinase [Clostridia bacterium]HHY05933.1 2-amino-4-hydroxy-6-hydroxymethyldihydropteridine diphosphokinase [Clostridia bacterium]
MKGEQIFLSLGSNVGDSLENLLQALLLLQEKGIVLREVSSIYQTAAVGYTEQADFLNMVVAGETLYSPEETLALCLAIEKKLGRVRTERWGPRTLDLDLLFCGEYKLNTPQLQLPHPRFRERAFVLVPLQEIAPEFLKKLQVEVPPQKVELLITASRVKMMLQKRGLVIK